MDQATDNLTPTTTPTQPAGSSGVDPKLVGQKMKQIWKNDVAKDGRKYADIPDEELGAMFIMKNGTAKLPALGISTDDKSGEATKFKNDVVDIAQNIQELIANKDKYNEKAYHDTLNSLASSLILKQKEADNLGAALSGSELSILSGKVPVTQQIGASIPQKIGALFSGKQPVQKGDVVDDEQTLRNKMAIMIAGMQGQKITPELFASASQANGQPQQPSLGENAAVDAKEILNGLLNIPADTIKNVQGIGRDLPKVGSDLVSGDPQRMMKAATYAIDPTGVMTGRAMQPVVQEANAVLGRPLEGGDIAGRIAERAYKKPVTTALDLLPFATKGIGAVKGRVGGVGATEAGAAETIAANTGKANPVQKVITGASELSGGGGSKEFVANSTRRPEAVPQRQVLMDEGILSHPTETGRIQATQKSLDKFGSQLQSTYEAAPAETNFTGDQVKTMLEGKLKEQGYDTRAIAFIQKYINNQGEFNLGAGDAQIKPLSVWKTAQNLEKAPPKMLKNPESATLYKQLSLDTARILRTNLAERLPEVKDLNARYGALRDYMNEGLSDPKGFDVTGGRGASGMINAGKKTVVDPMLNMAYKISGNSPQKVMRDMRYRQGNFVPKRNPDSSLAIE
jgi:hypothetical protein